MLATFSRAKHGEIKNNKAKSGSSVWRDSAADYSSTTKKVKKEKEKWLTSLLLGNRVGVNGHVESALVGRDLGRHHSSGNGNEDGGGSHFEGGLAEQTRVSS